WIPPPQVLECRALLEAYHDLRREHTAWIQRVHAALFHQGAPVFHDLSRAGAPAELAALARARLSPAGQQQVMLCLRMLEATGGELDGLRRQLLAAARHLHGAKVLAASIYVVGPVTPLALSRCPGGPRRCCAGRCMRQAGPTPAPPPPTMATTPPSRTARTASAPPCRRPARSSAGPAASWPSSATTPSPPCERRGAGVTPEVKRGWAPSSRR